MGLGQTGLAEFVGNRGATAARDSSEKRRLRTNNTVFGDFSGWVAAFLGEIGGFEFGTVIATTQGVRDQVAECALE